MRVLLGLSLVLMAGCSTLGLDPEKCASNAQCRSHFGALSVCGADGFCAPAQPPVRCDRSEPADLLDDLMTPRDTILLATAFDRSLETQRARERSVELAVRQANEVGGVAGRPVSALFCDISEDPAWDALTREEAAVQISSQLANELGILAIIGPSSSTDVLSAFAAISGSDTLMISPSATSPALSGVDTASPSDDEPGLLWRTAPPDSLQGTVIAQDVESRGITSVAVIHQTGAYGTELASVFVEAFTGDDMLLPFNDAADLSTAMSDASESSAEEVLFISSQSSEVVAFLTGAAADAGFADKSFFLTDAAANADVLEGASAASALFPRVRGTRPSVPDGFIYELFVASYDLAFEDDVTRFSFTAQSYDAAWLALYGVAWASFNEPEVRGTTIARGLRRISQGTPFGIRASTLAPIVQTMREGMSVDVEGASGELDYDPLTEETSSPTDVWVISADGTRIEVLETI
jgi:branched-chain amino acid transport system substrate-binding protein